MKWPKRIAAITTGALMLGATLAGALAASYDLADYPAPYLDDGVLDNTVIVVGAAANAADLLGAVDIAAALQAEAVTAVEAEGVTIDPTVPEGLKVEKSGDKFNYGDNISAIQSVYDDADMDMLEDVEYVDADYEQTLTFSTSAGSFVYASPGEVDETQFDGGNFLYFPDNVQVYSYAFAAKSGGVSYDAVTELETETLEIQGNTYTVTDIKSNSVTGAWTELVLQAGKTTRYVQADEPIVIGDDTVTVIGVNENEDVCSVMVNGQQVPIDVGDTETIDGLTIGVTTAFAGHGAAVDACEINIGAQELKLVDGQEVEMNGVELKGSTVTLTGNVTAGSFDGFTIVYVMDDRDFPDEEYGPAQYKMAEERWVDPIFGNFEILFEGVTEKTEALELNGGNNDGELKFTNTKGDEVVVPVYLDGSNNVKLGDGDTGLLLAASGDVDTDTVDDVKLWVVLTGGEVHVLEFVDFDDETDKFEFDDLTEGGTLTSSALSTTDGSAQEALTLGSLGSVTLGFDETSNVLNFTASGNTAETEYGMQVAVAESGANVTVTLTSPLADSDVQTAADVFRVDFIYDSSDEELDVGAPSVSTGDAFVASGVDAEYDDSDVLHYVSVKGVLFEHDDKEDRSMSIVYPESDVYANVFIAPEGSKAITSTAGTAGVAVNPFGVGLAVLDTTAASMSKNMIVVGGPCANNIAFALMGSPDNCAEGFEDGKAMLKSYDRNGKAALLVAGSLAEDTVRASQVLSQRNGAYASDFDALGEEVELVVADMSDVQFNTV
ncbi:S-layer protein [Candidatus Woesearchaeota archaeon]|nr:S-layer protein [Candidatus Woesearchaeota archaeon]